MELIFPVVVKESETHKLLCILHIGTHIRCPLYIFTRTSCSVLYIKIHTSCSVYIGTHKLAALWKIDHTSNSIYIVTHTNCSV